MSRQKFKYTVIFFLFFVVSQTLRGQYTLVGEVKDSIEGPLIGATVVLLEAKDSTFYKFAVTDDKGKFELKLIKSNNYILQITYIGYGTFEKELDIKGEAKKVDLGIFNLSNSNLLDAVTVTGALTPIIVKKDTVEYNAAAYKVRPNASVEELLKKLPGMEVDKEGNIKSEGEDVKQVLVDGKKFFSNDPKMATKNIPADAVDKVKVYDKKSDKAELTGIDDGNEQKTIDLKLKEGKKNGLFGQLEAGYGSSDRFTAKANLFSFSTKTQLSFISKYNNLNDLGLTFSEYSGLTASSGSSRSFSFNSSKNSVPVSFGNNITGDAKAGVLGANMNYIKSKETEFNLSYFLSGDKKFLTQNRDSENFLPSGNYFVNSISESTTDNLRHNIGGKYKTLIDSTHQISITGNLNFVNTEANQISDEKNSNDSRELQSENDANQKSSSDATNYGLDLSYTSKLNSKGRSFSLDGAVGNDNNQQALDLYQLLSFYENAIIDSTNLIDQNQKQNNDNLNYNFGISYVEPLGKNYFLSPKVNVRNNNSDRTKNVFDKINNGELVFNNDLSGLFTSQYQYITPGISIRKSETDLKWQLGLNFQNSKLKGTQNDLDPLKREFNFFLPDFSLDLDNIHISLDYRTSTNEPNITQLQPLPNNDNALSIVLGNENLKPEYTHRINLRYRNFDRFNFRSLWTGINFSYTTNNIINSKTVNEDLVQITKPVNVAYSESFGLYFSYGSPINPLHIKTRFNIDLSKQIGFAYLNNLLNKYSNNSNSITLSIENKNQNRISAEVWGKISWNSTNYRDENQKDNNYRLYKYGSELSLDIGKSWFLLTDFESNIYSSESFTGENTVNYWNASLSKSILSDRLEMTFLVNDILNQNNGVSRSISGLSISETTSNALGRYFLFKVLYKLTSFTPDSGIRIMKHR
ncbi:MAG: TonB-dependent receptor [Lewinellaceae bacterium]|nr:TonB-dependent receptor [Lewinellaceae bacterium]